MKWSTVRRYHGGFKRGLDVAHWGADKNHHHEHHHDDLERKHGADAHPSSSPALGVKMDFARAF